MDQLSNQLVALRKRSKKKETELKKNKETENMGESKVVKKQKAKEMESIAT